MGSRNMKDFDVECWNVLIFKLGTGIYQIVINKKRGTNVGANFGVWILYYYQSIGQILNWKLNHVFGDEIWILINIVINLF